MIDPAGKGLIQARESSLLSIQSMLIDNTLLDQLTAQEKASPRLRQHYDLRDSSDDESQRMLNAIEPGTVIPIHRHTQTSEEVP